MTDLPWSVGTYLGFSGESPQIWANRDTLPEGKEGGKEERGQGRGQNPVHSSCPSEEQPALLPRCWLLSDR